MAKVRFYCEMAEEWAQNKLEIGYETLE